MQGMSFEELELLQPEDLSNPDSLTCTTTTTILIHDGGGTVFPYHRLGPMSRNLYGIANPNFFSGAEFPGGVIEMGRLYADFIRSAIRDRRRFRTRRKLNGAVDILLGGWSFGGYLSLEVASQLRDDEDINVVGIVMVDSDYDVHLRHEPADMVPIDVEEQGRTATEVLSRRCMSKAIRMLDAWTPPAWENKKEEGAEDGGTDTSRPRCILIRCKDYQPTESGQVSAADRLRANPTLGWSSYDETLLEKVIDISGHHFNIFEEELVEGTTTALKEALEALDPIPPRWKLLQTT
ncbi:hypothetical protein N3K66_005116 [Trichothecium roseum]|uniref:Uncharacterized protein n=1 Tax=Trichothecium roseum TaxID=47278 RepID=A0ACC0V379_9HYPO|nr:hypothetical protein N3K66_005116 [Trichothecium roseum]